MTTQLLLQIHFLTDSPLYLNNNKHKQCLDFPWWASYIFLGSNTTLSNGVKVKGEMYEKLNVKKYFKN